MLSRIFIRSLPMGALRWGLALLVLATLLSSCADDAPPEAAKPTHVGPTAGAATGGPAPTPRPAAARPTATAGQPASRADWTVLVYLDGDNDLEPDAIDDYGEMASVGSSDRVNIVVQLDRISSSEDWDNSSY